MAHVTVPVTTRRVTYTASAAVGPYAFNYTVFSEDDLAVTVDGVAKVLTVDYTVSLTGGFDGGYPGGTITFGSAQTGEVVIDGDTTMGRLTDFPNSGPLSMISLNTDLDKRAAVDQQLSRDITDISDRADDVEDRLDTAEADIEAIEADIVAIEDDISETVRVYPGENGMILPNRVSLALKILGFTGAGEPVATVLPSVGTLNSGILEFNTRAAAAGATIGGAIEYVRLLGYYAIGDDGGGLYKKRVGAPSHAATFTSADGAIWELAEPVIRLAQLGAAGNGTADDGTAIGQWYTACSVLSRPGQATKGATYKVITGAGVLSVSNIDIDWNGATVNLVSAVNNTTALYHAGSVSTLAKTITVNASLDAPTLTLNNVTSLAVGQYLLLDASFVDGTKSHMAKITEIAGSVVTLSSPMPFALATTDTYTLEFLSGLLTNVKIRNLNMNGLLATGTGMIGAVFRFMDETCEIRNVRGTYFKTVSTGGTSFQYCYGTKIDHVSSTQSGSSAAAAIVTYHCSSIVFSNMDSDSDFGFGFESLGGSHQQFIAPKVQGTDGRAFKFAGTTNSTVIGGEINLDRGSGVGLAVTLGSCRNVFVGIRINGNQGSQSQGVWTSGFNDDNNTFIGLHISGSTGGAFNNPIAIAATDTGNRFIDCYVDSPGSILNSGGAQFFNLNGYAAFDVNDSGIGFAPVQTIHTHSATPANSDNASMTEYTGVNSNLIPIRYFGIGTRLNAVTAGAERGVGVFRVIINGAETEVCQVGDGNSFKPTANNVTELGSNGQEWSAVYATEYKVANTKVVGARGAAVADATDAASVIARLNDLLARLRTHGLIAT
jgi:hypothetical protein